MATSPLCPRQAAARRALMVLTLSLFVAGRLWAVLDRPSPPNAASLDPRWPPPPARILDATPAGLGVESFPPGTTAMEAIRSFGLPVDPLREEGGLPRAGVLVRGKRGWSVSPMTQSERWTWGIPMELTLCRAEDLARLPGIGPKLARRLEGFIRGGGRIGSVEDLASVPGFGRARMDAMSPFLEVEGS